MDSTTVTSADDKLSERFVATRSSRSVSLGDDRVTARRNRLRQLDACLEVLESAQEAGMSCVPPAVVKSIAVLVPEISVDTTPSTAIDLVFRAQQTTMRERGLVRPAMGATRIGDPYGPRWVDSGGASSRTAEIVEGTGVLAQRQARLLTDRIRAASTQLSALLLQAHERRAWTSLGYRGWADYIRIELGISRSRSYELLEHARVSRAIAEVVGVSGTPDISTNLAMAVRGRLVDLLHDLREGVRDSSHRDLREYVGAVLKQYQGRGREPAQSDASGARPGRDVQSEAVSEEDTAPERSCRKVIEALEVLAALELSGGARVFSTEMALHEHRPTITRAYWSIVALARAVGLTEAPSVGASTARQQLVISA